MRRFGDAVEGAQQALATGFLPVITRVSAEVQKIFADPQVLAQIKAFGQGAAGSIDDLIDVAGSLPWAAIGDAVPAHGHRLQGAARRFTGLPPWVQTAVLTGWGLNKLTGGALGNIVGELGKGLIKGVLGMNAGVVNINAATVNGAGGAGGVGGAGSRSFLKGLLGGLLAAGAGAGIGAAIAGPGFQQQTEAGAGFLKGKVNAVITGGNLPDIHKALKAVEGEMEALNSGQRGLPEELAYAFDVGGVKTTLEDQRDALKASLIKEENMVTSLRQAIPEAQRNRAEIIRLNANEGTRAANAQARLQAIRDSQAAGNSTLQQIRDKKSSVNVTVNTTTAVSLSASAVALQVQRVTQTNNVGHDINENRCSSRDPATARQRRRTSPPTGDCTSRAGRARHGSASPASPSSWSTTPLAR